MCLEGYQLPDIPLFRLYVASQNISIHSIIRNKCKVTRMGQYQQLIICRNTKKCFSRSARLTSQANILVAVRIIPRFFHRLKGFLNGIRILIGKMPPFSGIALEAMLFYHLLKKPRGSFRTPPSSRPFLPPRLLSAETSSWLNTRRQIAVSAKHFSPCEQPWNNSRRE